MLDAANQAGAVAAAGARAGIQPESEEVVEIDCFRDPRYEKFVFSHPEALIFHHPGWLRALYAESRTKLVALACQNRQGELSAVLPLAYTRGLPFQVGRQQTGRRLSSLPRTPHAGPLGTHPDQLPLLLQAAVHKAEAEGVQLQIKSHDRLPAGGVDGLAATDWRPTYVLSLGPEVEGLKFTDSRNRHRIKSAVKQAEKNGLQLRPASEEGELRAWYGLYLQTMRRNIVPPRSLRLFLALWKELRALGAMQLLLVEQQTGTERRLVTGAILFRFGRRAWYAFTGVGDRDLSLHSNDLLLWHAIREAGAAGITWFDFGEVAEEHPELVRFKTKWGAQPLDQYRYYSGAAECAEGRGGLGGQVQRCCRAVWQHLPLAVTAQLGDLVYRRL